MRTPNLFIIGAPKCGTTALYEYLRHHPDIFMSPLKEPHYFATDLPEFREPPELRAYLALFQKATDDHIAVGEASPLYFCSRTAVSQIRKFEPAARIIVMLRNPVDLVYAWHGQLVLTLDEAEPGFERAWRLQEARRKGNSIPKACRNPMLLDYHNIGSIGSHYRRLLNHFPPEQVKTVLFDDLVQDTRKVYEEVLRFLGIDSDHRAYFPRINESSHFRALWFQRLIRPNRISRPIRVLGRKFRIHRLLGQLEKLNRRRIERPPIDTEFRYELGCVFQGEIEILAGLLGRELTEWTVPEPHAPEPKC